MTYRQSRNKTQILFNTINSVRQKFLKKQDRKSQKQQNYLQLNVRAKSVLNQHVDNSQQQGKLDFSVIKKKYYPQYNQQEQSQKIIQTATNPTKNAYGQVLQKQQKVSIGNPQYNLWDLTYTFISLQSLQINLAIIGFIFSVLVIIRYFTISILIYIAVISQVHIDWIIVIIVARVLYFILVVKISLKTPQSKTQIVLKRHWNSKQSDVSQIFEIIDSKKLFISFLRGIIPAQLSFFYIQASQKRKQFQIYAAINYIYASIQCIVYYPFIVIYLQYLHLNRSPLNKYQQLTLILSLLAFGITLIFSFVLFMIGIKKRHGKLCFCCS